MAKDYNQLFKNGPLAFMQKYSVVPANHIGSHGDYVDELDRKGKIKIKANRGISYEYNRMGNANLVGYLDFTKIHHDTANALIKGQVMVTGNYTPDVTKVESYFLPWYDEKIISLTIPPMPSGGGGTRTFFTAAISGCSVIIKGTPQSPTIFHAGGKTTKPGSDPKDGAQFWRNMMKTLPQTAAGKIMGEANKTMYVTDKRDKMVGTANSRLFMKWLNENPRGFRIEDVDPTGCVFGRREGGNWTFWLQENATIRYTSFAIQLDGTLKETTHSLMRPMQISEIFPNGQKHVKVNPLLSRPLKV